MKDRKERVVRVDEWSNGRRLIETDNKVALEIALSHNHCPTCADRVRHVNRRLDGKNVQYSWRYDEYGPGSFLELDRPADGMPVTDYLSDLLGLNIR
jgi:hypothetical protein